MRCGNSCRAPRPRPTTVEIVDVTGRNLTIEHDQIAEADVGGVVIHNMLLAFADLPIFDNLGLGDAMAQSLGKDIPSPCERVSIGIGRREGTFTMH
jgi:Cu/Ag efflux protein CusF